MREFKADEVTFKLDVEYEDMSIEGNVMASGDDEADKKAEKWVRDELERGNVWAWACVKVTAKWAGFEGWGVLGGVSCQKAEDFTDDGMDDLTDQAIKHLISNIREAGWKVEATEADVEKAYSRGRLEMIEAA